MQSAESIDFSSSNLGGNITKLFQRLPQCYPNKLKEMHLRDNKFSGVLPNWIGRWTSLVTLDFSYNQLMDLCPLLSVHWIILLTWTSVAIISMVWLPMNTLLTKLKFIDLSRNSLKIMLDPEWLPPFRLENALITSCQMGPLFPVWLQSQVDIIKLDISNASIFDRLPDWFSTVFQMAWRLDISKNAISGTLLKKLDKYDITRGIVHEFEPSNRSDTSVASKSESIRHVQEPFIRATTIKHWSHRSYSESVLKSYHWTYSPIYLWI